MNTPKRQQTKAQPDYDASSIEVLPGLEPVRRRPGMYTDTRDPSHLAIEVIDNAVDEALAGVCTTITVHLHSDGSVSVRDNGRGMPIDPHPDTKRPAMEVIFTTLHAGAKFSREAYRYAGGLHGVGVSVVAALSHKLVVESTRGGVCHRMAFQYGEVTEPLEQVPKIADAPKRGTRVRFWPDASYFDTPDVGITRLRPILRAKAVLLPGLSITLVKDTDGAEPTVETFLHTGTLSALLPAGSEAHTPTKPIERKHDSGDAQHQVAWALQWSPSGPLHIESWANMVPTSGGGSHVNGFRAGVVAAILEYCELQGKINKRLTLTPDDIMGNAHAVLSSKLAEPSFVGQTKDRLRDRAHQGFVTQAVKDALSLWLNRHTTDADRLLEMMLARCAERQRKSQGKVTHSSSHRTTLPGKLADCTSSTKSIRELFLVEGESAGGSARAARDRKFQAILPLRGKIKNTWDTPSDDILTSEAIRDIAVAIGLTPGDDDLTRLRYGKVCVLADADSDGAHIAALLCALFAQHFPALIQSGHLYVAQPPLFRVKHGRDSITYLHTTAALRAFLDSLGARAKSEVQRFKGLGEMNASQLRETVMLPESRVLLRVHPGDQDADIMPMLFNAHKSKARREWLERRGSDVVQSASVIETPHD